MAKYDLVIRGGLVVDGSGGQPYQGDIAIRGDRIMEIGEVRQSGAEEINAKGLLVTPGFIDVHTHFDGQATWSDELAPVSQHGVTTALMGNCGVGFAPCRPDERRMLLDLMEGVEDIPQAVMEEGIPWDWESFPQYLDALEQRQYDIDIGAQIAHAPVRIYAMGKRGQEREPANEQEIGRMAAIVKEAVIAGAFGFSTTRSLNNRSKDGSLSPTFGAREDELKAMACAMGELGRGLIEINDQWLDLTPEGSPEFEMMKRVVKASGRPMSFAVAQEQSVPEKWRWILQQIEQANGEGVPMRAQVISRPIGVLVGLDLSFNPFMFCPSWTPLERMSLEERVRAMRDPSLRAKLLAEEPVTTNPLNLWLACSVENMSELGDPPDYSPPASALLGERAKSAGKSARELAYELLLKHEGRNILYHPVVNYAHGNLDHVPTLLRHEHSVIGIGDGGAHVGIICDASIPTHLLTYWTRDRQGERLTVPEAIEILTQANARFLGLKDRGLLRPGLKADVNVIDYDRLHLHAPRPIYDLPSGARRLMQDTKGYVATIKSGEITYREGKSTGRKPGRLLRAA